MLHSPFYYFTDAVLRAPTLGCMFMCLAAALVGVVVFLKKQSLLGESLSHAAYPGVIIGAATAGALNLNENQNFVISILIMTGAIVTCLAGLWAINFLERRMRVRSDSALCFVLSAFFGVGLTLASQVQFSYSSLYRQAQVYLYGQAATMTDIHIYIYGILSTIIIITIVLFYKEIRTIAFDRTYARSIGINARKIDFLVFSLVVLAVVIGIRSVGVVLMSAMLIAPAAAARQYTNKLYIIFIIAGLFGIISAFLGNYLSVELTNTLAILFPAERLTLPTGPMIVIVASILCLLSLLLAPERGVLLRVIRIARFHYRCLGENILKALWRFTPDQETSFNEIAKYQQASFLSIRLALFSLTHAGWIAHTKQGYLLTTAGKQRAARIIRLHRLWEVYLVDYLGIGIERVHRSAEEMEHTITPELEKQLTELLNNPKYDPHAQPIPPEEPAL